MPAKKTTETTAKKTTAKKSAAKKTAAKKTSAKKSTAKKTTAKSAAKKTSTAKKAVQKALKETPKVAFNEQTIQFHAYLIAEADGFQAAPEEYWNRALDQLKK